MNFPAWELPFINGGLVIASIAVLHMFVAQLAVGGGFFLVLAERKGHRENSLEILNWVKGHTNFFLLVTMVFGGLSGVGIWLSTALVSPSAVSFLVRNFTYAWASEWAFFLGEIVALLLYSATFKYCIAGRMSPKEHMYLGWAYAAFAFLSLFAINGVVSFMLTPGDWSGPEDFWTGIFNPSFWPALFYRFALSLLLAGLFGLVTGLRIQDSATRERMLRWCSLWVCVPFVVMAASALWYASSMPGFALGSGLFGPFGPLELAGLELPPALLRRTADVRPFVNLFMVVTPLLLFAGVALFLFLHRMPASARLPLVLLVLLVSLAQVGAFEWMRETTRRPYVIYGQIYSNDIQVAEAGRMNKEGALTAWGGEHDLSTAAGKMQAGRFLFSQQCFSCHGLGGPMLNVGPRVAGKSVEGIEAQIVGQGKLLGYMPPFFGKAEERNALAFYLWNLFTVRQP